MTHGSILAFFGDASAATAAYGNLQRQGYTQIALITRAAGERETDKNSVSQPRVVRPRAPRITGAGVGAATGAGIAAAVGRLVEAPRAIAPAFPIAGAIVGGGIGYVLSGHGAARLPDATLHRYRNSVMGGETLVIVRAPSNYLKDALAILREGEGGPAVFLERNAPDPFDISKAPLRRDVLNADQLRDLALELGARHGKTQKSDGTFLLSRLRENRVIIARVAAGLTEAARLDQAVSLSAEWLLDNNYVVQGQIKDVERNLTPKFLRELPAAASGRYTQVPRVYLLASELVAATDGRFDRDILVSFIHHYQAGGSNLTTGELWALPLMLRLAIIENLRRLTAQADKRQRERERSDFWANRLLAAAFREPDQILPLLAELSKEQKKIAPHFADRLVSHLFDEEAALGPVRSWLERKMSAPLGDLTSREQRRQAVDAVSIGNAITTMRFLANLDWRECFEQLSLVDQILSQDPAGVYRSMDFATRDRYRKKIEKLARHSELGEITISQRVVQTAALAGRERMQRAAPSHGEREHETLIYQPVSHVGYYLIDDGRVPFELSIGFRNTVAGKWRRWLRYRPGAWYFAGVAGGTAMAMWGIERFARAVGGALPWPLRVLAFLPSSEVATQVVNYAVTRLMQPRALPKMEFKDGIPNRWKTIIAIPMLLGSAEDGVENARQLEIHYLSNTDPNLRYALLADYTDAQSRQTADDAERLEAARAAIANLNAQYGPQFFLFIRERRWSETEERWMGWERKRGKLEEFNRYLLGARNPSPEQMHVVEGEPGELDGIKFVITLDADTQMPYGAARRMIEAIAHPLNRPHIGKDGLVERGYTLIQPRVDTMLPSAMATRYSRLFSTASGLDPYTNVVSDVYQDAFGEGSYHGKGIYDLEAFERVLGNRFPDATLLSHDLIEGAHVRVGLASDIVLLDDFPPQYQASLKRDHRWMRGDWQIADWAFGSVPTPRGREKNPLSRFNRWKVADNLRRSLLAPASVALLIGGWMAGGPAAVAASVGVAGLVLWPTAINVFTRLTTRPDRILRGRHEIGRGLIRAGIETSLLLHRSGMSLDAIGRSLFRKSVSHKLMLEWQTAASTYRGGSAGEVAFMLRMASGSALSGAIALAVMQRGATAIVAASPYLLAWAVAPLAIWWLAGGREERQTDAIGRDDETYVRAIARQTWRYFDDFVGPQTNWLPPDNYQEALNVEIAQRTSPTNMGLWLLACVAAHDFGWLTLDEVAERARQTLQTFDEMEKFQGHFYNWYGSLDAKPLLPRYISTVDSGNLLGSLWTMARSMKELYRAPLFDGKALSGLLDVLNLLESALGDERAAFEAELSEIRQLAGAPHGSQRDIFDTLRRLEAPIVALSRALSMRELPRRASQRSRSNLESGATDPRFTITPISYWAAQLETQLELWTQSVSRYGKWLEILAQPADEFLLSLGADAPDLRREIFELSPSLTELARGEAGRLNELLERRHREETPEPVREWAQKIADEWDNARWLAGEMLGKCDDVIDRSRGIAGEMKMGFLFDSQRKLFSIGFNVEEQRLDSSFYDLLASECRLASFCAVARGDVPAEHWLALGRRFGQTPVGPALMSWSGTMFEYLMPMLFQKAFDNSLLERAENVAVAAQIAYGARRRVPWGISEAAYSAIDASGTYQYKAFGVPGLGLKRGLEEDLVIAPYATLMALMVDRGAAISNLRELEKIGARGDYGFYESIDFTRQRLDEDSVVAADVGELARVCGRAASKDQRGAIVRCFMVHHQGMALLAMQNVLCEGAVQRRFHSDVYVEAAEPLLFEKIPEAPPVLENPSANNVRPTHVENLGGDSVERPTAPDTPAVRAHLLGSERYNVMMSAAGAGFSRWGEFEITRWRADPTRDNWGQFIYLRDLDSNLTWSATHQPLKRKARNMGVSFKPEKVEFDRYDSDIESRLEICVSPEDNVEVRRLTLVNHSSRERRVEATSFAELSLAPHATDRAHPAFNKLFIQTGVVIERAALLAWRRLRQPKDTPVWAVHLTATSKPLGAAQWETDRLQFLGRARSARSPVALDGELSGTTGAVLDPCFALRREATLKPGERVQICWVTGAADSQENANRLIERYGDFGACERAFDLAWTHSQLELHHLQIKADEAQSFQQLGGYLLYPNAALRAPASRIRANDKGQSGLWAYGISGDLPILLVAIDNARDLIVVRQALRAHTFWRVRGMKVDLVIVNEQAGGYAQDLTETLRKLIEGSTPYTGTEKPGGVFLRSADTIPPEDMTLLLSVARVVLVAARGGISQQLGLVNDDMEAPPRFVPTEKTRTETALSLPFMELPYFNGLGGFTQDGEEYAIYLGPNDTTPAPWINVFAHEDFGALVSEAGQGFAWYGNSQANRITPWNNDAVSDTADEAIYIRDEETGEFWTPTSLPIREQEAYRARHGQGYSVFEHSSHGIEQTLTAFVPMDDAKRPIRLQTLKLTNRSGRARKLSATSYAQWILGTHAEETRMQIVTSWDTQSSTLLARNAYNPNFPHRLAFASATPQPQSFTADRMMFLGRNGSPINPFSLRRKTLQNSVGAALDACAALQVPVELAPNESIEVTFMLGEADSVEQVRSLVSDFRAKGSADKALAATRTWWNEMESTLQVEVPDKSVNFLINRWLPYQILSCRIWARSAFYQSGGAWGYRDQMQDSLALTTLYPKAARDQILRCAAHQFEEGDVQHWWHPPGDAGVRTLITDDLLFLPYGTAQYVKVTGDTAILDEVVPFLHADVLGEGEHEKYFEPQISEEKASVFEHCRRAIEKGCTSGPNGLPLIGGGDWNDGLNRVGIEGRGESVWLAWFCADVLNSFAEICDARGEDKLASDYRERAKTYVANIEKNAWDGAYYRRGYFDDGTPLGSHLSDEAKIDSLPQSWSVIAGGGDAARSRMAMDAVEQHLIDKEKKIVKLFTPAFDKTDKDPGYIKGYLPGVRENGGQYTHAACWVAYAYALAGRGDKAVETLNLMNPVQHARTPEAVQTYKVEPYVVTADVYDLEGQVGRGGWSWYTGSCGWMYRVWVEGVLGFDKRGDTLHLNPAIPSDWTGFKLIYKHGSGVYQIEVVNPGGAQNGVAKVEVDGKLMKDKIIPLADDGKTHAVLVTMGTATPPDESVESDELAPDVPPATNIETVEAPAPVGGETISMTAGTELEALQKLQREADEGAEFNAKDVEEAPIVAAQPELPQTEVEISSETPEQVTNFEPLRPIVSSEPKIETLEELKLETNEEADARPMESIARAGESPTIVTKSPAMPQPAPKPKAKRKTTKRKAKSKPAPKPDAPDAI